MNEQRPVFVYGTLRHGQGNYRHLLAGRTNREEHGATLPNHQMWSIGIPFVLDGDGTVHGDLMYLSPSTYAATLRDLDRLEGYKGPGLKSNMYERVTRPVTLANGEVVEAYVYHASDRRAVHGFDPNTLVPSGDWVAHVAPEDAAFAS